MKKMTIMDKKHNRNDPKHIVYHYCLLDSFKEIIEKKTLWLSDSSATNDGEEIIRIDSIVADVVAGIKKRCASKAKINDIEKFEKTYLNIPNKKHYFVSFSRNKDLLSQWRGYADNGQGVSIGFQFGLLCDLIGITSKSHGVNQEDSTAPTTSTFILGYENIIYDTDKIKTMIEQIIKVNGTNTLDAMSIKELATTIKNESFSEECETRITYTPANPYQTEENKFIDNSLKRLSVQKYRVSNNNMVPYFELNYNCEFNSLLLPEIVLGPKCKLEKNVVEEFLRSNQFDATKILKSKSSYR